MRRRAVCTTLDGMTDKEIALPLTADLALADAVSHWKALDKDPLLEVGDTLNDINNRSQLALGAWLTVFEDVLGYGAIKDMADRWDRKPQTLHNWKSVYRKTQNLPPAVSSLSFSKVSELARIPAEYQFDWLTSVESLKRAEIRAAIKSAKESGDWTPPTGDIIVLESSDKQVTESQPEYRRILGRLYWRRDPR